MQSRTQRVTAVDIRSGRIRVPHETKALFPRDMAYVDVVLRGRALNARWDPRMGPDRERSGVLLIGRGALPDLVSPDEVLAVSDGGRGPIRID